MPGLDSTPDDTSTAYGCTAAIASRDVIGGQSARQNDRPHFRGRGGLRPVDRPARAAALDRIVRVEQHRRASGHGAHRGDAVTAVVTATDLITRSAPPA